MNERAVLDPRAVPFAAEGLAAALDSRAVRWGADGLAAAVVQDHRDGRVLMVGWQDAEALSATLATGEVHFHSRSRGRLWRKGETSGNVLRLVDAALDCDADALLLRVDPVGPTCHTGTRSCFDPHPADARAFQGAPTPIPPQPPVAPEPPTAPQPPIAQPPFAPQPPVAPEPPMAPESRLAPTWPMASDQGFDFLEALWRTIAQRAADRPPGSYTVRLLEGGVDFAARKVAEEAVEVLLAAKDDASAESSVAEAMYRGEPAQQTRDQSALAGEFADLLYHALVLMAERDLPPSEVIAVLRRRAGAR